MKIGVLTYHFAHNYGAMLQAYALQRYLFGCGHEVDIIDYRPEKLYRQYRKGLKNCRIEQIPSKVIKDIRRWKQIELFEQFSVDYLKCNSSVDKDELKTISREYDAIIVGSDQVWNNDINFNDQSYFLDFVVPSCDRVGYSISIGKAKMTDKLARSLSVHLDKFNSVSFRELSASKTVEEYTGISLPVTVDPVFLLSRKDWKRTEKKPEGFQYDKFILYYSLSADDELDTCVKEIANSKDLPIVSMHPLCRKISRYGEMLTNVGPKEFLWLIDNASYIASNSFHATAFSVIFGKEAIIKPHKQLGARNIDLLNLAGYSCSEECRQEIYDFSKADTTALCKVIEYSKNYLNSLSNEKHLESIKYPKWPQVYAARAKSKDLLLSSSSGAMFTVLSREIIKNGGYIVAATYVYESHSVIHDCFNTEDELMLCRGSKYIQSDLRNSYKKVIEKLKGGNLVLFIGTACQVAGLSSLCNQLNVNKENLYLCDIICHGVPSPSLWRDYIKNIEKKFGKITSITFRDKRIDWMHPVSVAKTENGEVNIRPFADMFYSDCFLRKSCYECKYSSVSKPSDITLGDFWGIDTVLPEFYNSIGNSLVIVHTEKGKTLFDKVKDDIECNQSNVLACIQKNLIEPTMRPTQREAMWEYYHKNGVDKLQKRYFPKNKVEKVIFKIRRKLKV